MICADLVALGVTFYDAQREHGYIERVARHSSVAYMRRKDADVGDAMPYYEALADALARRASGSNRISSSYVNQNQSQA